MFGEYNIKFGASVRRWSYLMVSLFVMLSLSSLAIADADQSGFLLRTIGPSLHGPGGNAQSVIDQLSKRLAAEPYRAELYYHLANAYETQGWNDKAAQYMNQWVRFSNPEMLMQGDHVFALDEKNDAILVIDRATKHVIRKIDVGWSPKKMIPTPDGSQLYVTNALSNNVSAIDTKEMSVTDIIKAGRMPWNGKASPQGDRVYVTNLKSNDVSVIDVANNSVLETVSVGNGPWGIAVSTDGHRLYISNQNSQDIQVIDTGSYSVVDVISVGNHPRDIALAPDDENKLYAIDSNILSDEIEIYVIDLGNTQVAKRINVPATNDLFLKPFEQMSLNDKLALLKDVDIPDLEIPKRVPRPELRGIPALVAVSHPLRQPFRPVTTARGSMSEVVVLPMGGPAALVGPEPILYAYVKAPVTSINSRLMSLPEPEQTVTEKEGDFSVPQEPAEQEEAPKQGKRILRIIVVVRNDSLWKISMNNYGTYSDNILAAIQDTNPDIKNPDRIYLGQKIKLPVLNIHKAYEGKTVKIEADDNLFSIAMRNYGTISEKIYAEIRKANPRVKDITLIRTGQRIVLPAIPGIPFRDGSA